MALQRVALDPAQADARGAGVAALARLLWAGGEPAQRFPGLSYSRAELLAAVRPHLTAAEQARLPQPAVDRAAVVPWLPWLSCVVWG